MKDMLSVAGGFAAGVLAVCLLDVGRARFMERRDASVPGPSADFRLGERVRAKLGEWVSDPGAVEIKVVDGIVRVSGQVPANELDGLLSRLTGVRGVRKVHNALSSSSDAES